MEFIKKYGVTGNMLKIIAAISMVIDHVGHFFFPEVDIFRIIGRIAFPIFAFMIAEGCEYTKNKLRYFLAIFLLGAACQILYFTFDQSAYMGILITFSLSILVIYALQNLKTAIVTKNKIFIASVIFIGAIVGVYFLNEIFHIDYRFFGCMTPVFASLLRKPVSSTSALWSKLDNHVLHIIMLGLCLVLVWFVSGKKQLYALIALPLLLLYSGKKGTLNLKYFFYIFYPAHLAILQGIAFLLD